MSGEIKLTTRHALRVLRPGPFRRYIIGSAISDTGTWMQVMAQGWVMATLTNKAIFLGLVQLCAGLPMLALTMIGGAAADRFDKRKILLITQYVQIAIAISIGWLIWSGNIAIWQIFIFAAILGVSNSFEMPTLSALVPELVKRDEIQGAISLDRSVFHGSRMVGFSLSGILISAWGMASAFFANALSFIALIVAILSLPPRARGTAEEEQKRASILFSDRADDHELVRPGNKFRARQHHCARARAGLLARAGLGCLHVELCRAYANRWTWCDEPFRFHWNANSVEDRRTFLWRNHVIGSRSSPTAMLRTGAERGEAGRNADAAGRRCCLA